MTKLLTIMLGLAVGLATAVPAFAAMSDEDYVTHAFGTVLVLHTPRQVINPDQGWWGDKAAKEFLNPSYLIGIINSRRMDKKVTPLLDPNDSGVILLDLEETEASGYRYSITFAGLRPSEVQALVELLGGPGKVLAGATSASYEPLQRHSTYASSTGGAPLVLTIGTTKIETSADVDFAAVRSQVDTALQGMFGKKVPFDFTVTRSVYMDGTSVSDVSVYVDLNPPPPPTAEELNEEQGE